MKAQKLGVSLARNGAKQQLGRLGRLLKLTRSFEAPYKAISRCTRLTLASDTTLQAVSIASPAYALNEAAKLQEKKSWSARLLETLVIIDGKNSFLLRLALAVLDLEAAASTLSAKSPSRRSSTSSNSLTLSLPLLQALDSFFSDSPGL